VSTVSLRKAARSGGGRESLTIAIASSTASSLTALVGVAEANPGNRLRLVVLRKCA
jgi:hypothetical protein